MADERSPEESEAILDANRKGMPFVVYRDARGRQRIVTLPEGRPVTIGRGSWMDISLSWDGMASRLHTQLERVGDGWTVVDDGLSRNGTFLNGERVEGRRRLGDGDEIKVGDTTLQMHLPGQLEEDSTMIADVPEEPG